VTNPFALTDSARPLSSPQLELEADSPRLLHEWFERQADTRPNAIALVCAGQSLTYGEVEHRANQLAHWLRQQGIGRGNCVALWMPRSLEMLVALLGILKAGAAYVPLDPEYPADRVRFILGDCQARALITRRALADKLTGFAGKTLLLDDQVAALASLPTARITCSETGLTPEDLCYIIYTSGTTGQPKGVQIEHRSVCHLVRAEAELFRVQPSDRVWQGFSIAFDASVEEIWLALFAGATLVVGTSEMVRSGPALSRTLAEFGITVLSCVPTLLAMMEQDVPSLRLLILGGEVCPPDLVKRWWTSHRRVINTYGPTEATVIATWAECRPGQAVTIGRPVPNYFARILDEHLLPVVDGVAGELCLGGPGLARGYLGQPELTREKFILLPQNGSAPQRFYRTGDLARWTPSGELEFLGRIDAQVKIRGFRVELSEIEAALLEECPEIKAAAVTLREPLPGVQQLVGYVVPRNGPLPDAHTLLGRLRTRLPAYMIPALLETLAALPTLPSGKVDRKALPAPKTAALPSTPAGKAPRTPRERQLAACWERLFSRPVSVQDDFFLELGGHSLLAARMVSELRQHAVFAKLSVLDVYRHPTIESLAAALDATQSAPRPSVPDPRPSSAIPFWRHFLCGAAQFLSLPFILTFSALQWLTPYLVYTVLVEEEYDFLTSILGAFASLILFYPVMVLVPIVVKWLLIGRYRPGAYPLWGSFYFRWWLATTIEAAVPVSYLTGTPLLNVYLRLMGARIGREVHLATDNFVAYDLLSIGDGSSINVDSNLVGYTVEDGYLKIGRITIGQRCYVGARSALRENTTLEDEAALENLSYLAPGATIPRGQTWLGSPAAETSPSPQGSGLGEGNFASRNGHLASQATPARRLLFTLLHGLGLLIFPVLVVAALFPGIVVMNKLNYIDPYYWYLFLAPLVGVSFILLLALEIAAVKWLLLGKVKPGCHSLHSFYYLRKWFVDQTMDLSLDILGPLYASIYLAPWYKLLGAKFGRGAEVSTASFISPDLLSIGEDSFIADSVSLGAPRVRDGLVTVGRNHIGRRSFIGNSAMLPPESAVGDNVLIGCLSAPPAKAQDALREDTAWLGSPSFLLPQRQKSTAFSEETTFKPSAKLQAMRAFIEFVRVITPSTLFIILISLLFSAMLLLHDVYSLPKTLLFVPALYIGCALAAVAFTIVAKWLIVWRYRPGEKPLWCTFVWRNELLNALHEHLAEPFLVGELTGTPFICWYFRLLGAHIGRRVYMETTDISEFDLARIGDEATLNADCTIQTHLFEDRVMKMSTVEIGPGCKVGAGSLVLYDTHMEPGSALGDLSLLMKGETLPAGTHWQGIPARAEKPPQSDQSDLSDDSDWATQSNEPVTRNLTVR
jgi:non-ribosomal peptide synthetase-like protein